MDVPEPSGKSYSEGIHPFFCFHAAYESRVIIIGECIQSVDFFQFTETEQVFLLTGAKSDLMILCKR